MSSSPTNGSLPGGAWTGFGYDARNRLVSVGQASPPVSISYTYDPAGNRIALTNAGVVTRFVVDPNTALSRVFIRIRPGVTNYYVYGLGLLYEVTETATSSYARYYHYDYRGSTVALTDSAGTVTDRFEYSAYGLLTYRTGSTDTPFLFNGRYGVQTDPNGLLYMRARYYNPYICRFINPDPIGFAGGLNWYAYADGNPVSYLDPFGLCAAESGGFWSWLGSAGGGFVEAGWDTISGLWSAVTHPLQTASGLWNAVTHPGQTIDALSIALAEYADRALGGDPRAFGAGAFELAGMVFPAGKVRYLEKLSDVGRTAKLTEELSAAARRAAEAVGPGKGPVHGTRVHTAFKAEVQAMGNPNLLAERSFKGGGRVEYGTPGSVRVDAVLLDPATGQPVTVFDLKTGAARLTPERVEQIQRGLDAPVPVIEIRP